MRPSRNVANRSCRSSDRPNLGRLTRSAFAATLAGVTLAMALGSGPVRAADPPEVGLWETVSDVTGKPEGYIRIRLVGDELRGVIERGLPTDDPNDICTKCPGDRKGQRMIGLTIISGLHLKGEEWTGGEILDPNKGWTYRCRIRAVEGGRKLLVRGYLGISLLGRTQTWVRAE